jgi:hypothetical protein
MGSLGKVQDPLALMAKCVKLRNEVLIPKSGPKPPILHKGTDQQPGSLVFAGTEHSRRAWSQQHIP